ncbi:MAG TPA: DNA repair protein RecO [Oscillatoriaceae cyanobacterium]
MTRTSPLTAIALRGYPLNEADRILVLMTREEGLKRVLAKGLRKPKNRIGGRLEPLRENELLLAKGRNLDIVTQVDSLRAWPDVQRDFDCLAAAMGAAELLIAFVEEGDPHPEVYDLFVDLLAALRPGVPAETLLAAFELQLLDLVGYRPDLAACMACDRPLEAEDVHGLNVEGGGAVCVHCEGLMSGRVRRLSAGAWQMLTRLQETPLAECATLTGEPRLLANCRHVLKDYLSLRAERELKAQGMFDWSVPG